MKESYFLYVGVAALAITSAGQVLAQPAHDRGKAVETAPPVTSPSQAASPQAASPQAASPQASELQDIIVTASKRAENSQKVSAAVTAVSGAELATAGITDQTRLETAIPSLVVGAKGGIDGLVFLRGIGQTVGANNAQDGVAVNFDGIFLQREIGVSELFDLERVEVLPGPQGTLYGGSAAGGIISYQTARPTNKFGGNFSVEGGNYGLIHAMGNVNLPVDDKLAIRLAGNYNHHDGYESNGLDDAQSLNGRVSLLWKPKSDLSIFALVQYDYRGGNGPGNLLKGPGAVSPYQKTSDPWFNSYPTSGLFINSKDIISLVQADYHFGGNLNLFYIGSYSHSKSDNVLEFQFLYRTPFQTVNSGFPVDMTQYSQELRLSNDSGGRSKWIAGLYWAQSDHFFELALPYPSTFVFVPITNKLKNYAAYGQYTYSLTDQLRLTAGGRLSSDSYNGGGALIAPPALRPYTFGGASTKQHVDWKVAAEFDILPHSMAYIAIQTGFVQGGYTQTPASSGLPNTLQPETLTSYTAGVKNRFLANTIQINDEVFYYDYKNLQQQLLSGVTNIGVNFPKTAIYGNQLDLMYLLTANDQFDFDAEYLSARVKSGIISGLTTDFHNLQNPGAPSLTISAGLRHDFPFANGSKITFGVHTYYNSGYWETFTHDINSHQDRYVKTDLNLTYYTASKNWSVGAFVRNLENAAVYSACAGATLVGDPNGCFIQPPRTFGARLEGRF